MNRAFCNSCKKLVPATPTEREGMMLLVKKCPDCGDTETLISSSSARYQQKHALGAPFDYRSCKLDCVGCHHSRVPNLVFVDITNRCNLNCPCCINNTPAMGFLFEPPLEYFHKVFAYLGSLDPKPSIQLFGGEPTVRKDLFEIIACAKSYGLPTRVVTNGIKLADADYCRRLIESKATINIAYDGANPDAYRVLRNAPKALEKKQQAIENIRRIGGAKVVMMTLAARGFNDHEFPELFQFCHDRRDAIRAIYFMPLAHTWDTKDFDLVPPRTTPEDIEQLVADVYPDDKVEFLPAGFLGRIKHLLVALRVKPLPFLGAHPNCESMYMLISDGARFLPIGHYLKGSLFDLARDLAAADERLARKMPPDRKLKSFRRLWIQTRAFLAMARLTWRHARKDRVFKGKTKLRRFFHALALPFGFIFGRRTRRLMERHTNVQGVFQLVILPFEDMGNIETDRLEQCPTAFAYYDPVEDQAHCVPTCAWGLHKTPTMKKIADHYAAQAVAPATQ
ncbi:MAG: radical SAM protein [Planctomycetes bacterium]|nr:radical SAM protein [Planctomycetota bacterium]